MPTTAERKVLMCDVIEEKAEKIAHDLCGVNNQIWAVRHGLSSESPPDADEVLGYADILEQIWNQVTDIMGRISSLTKKETAEA